VSSLLIRNLGGIVSGMVGQGLVEASTLLISDGRIESLEEGPADRVVDAAGAVAVPGLIDSHAHVVFGDWTPRQSAIGWIESSLHGGVTMMMSASEVHLPGRPHDREGVKALALTAQRAYADHRPGGVKVMGGSVIFEPVLEAADFEQLAAEGVWLGKVGFGDFSPQAEAAELVRAAQSNGFVVMNHTGGASIPDSSPVTIDDVLALGSDIIGHANGGPTALPDEDLPRLFDAPGAIQLVQAGNLRSALRIVELAQDRQQLERIVLATDTPTGTGVIPLGMLRTIAEISSLGEVRAADAIAMATGNNARVLRREEGILEPGRPADVVFLQVPLGSAASDPLSAIELGDLPSITGVFVDGEPLVTRSRNTPAPLRAAQGVAA
jgi:enamidase